MQPRGRRKLPNPIHPPLDVEDDGILCYTDGSWSYKTGIGAWAFVVIDKWGHSYLTGAPEWETTISRMELQAAVKALEYIRDKCGPTTILVVSDSEYVVKGVMNRSRKRNANVDLWWDLDRAIEGHDLVEFDHVRGHSENHYNDMVDEFAVELRLGATHGSRSSSDVA